MNRNQRRLGRAQKKSVEERVKGLKRNGIEIEEVLLPKNRRDSAKVGHHIMRNRCCFVSPDQEDFRERTIIERVVPHGNILVEDFKHSTDSEIPYTGIQEFGNTTIDFSAPSESLRKERCSYESEIIPETICQLKELKKMLCPELKVENSSQYDSKAAYEFPDDRQFMVSPNGSPWQTIDNADDIDKFLKQDKREQEKAESPERNPQNIHISDAPRVKVIAEKYSKYKKDNIEVRRLEEKIVCVEYDVYDLSIRDTAKPVQIMRAFFTVKPVCTDENGKEIPVTRLPSDVKTKFNVADEDLKKLSDKQLEIIDGCLEDNKPYLDDLKKILKRNKHINDKKNKSSLDLMTLYEMARKEQFLLDSNISKANILSNAELQEIKDLILKRCSSSVHGMRRTKMRRRKETADVERDGDTSTMSNSIIAELIKQDLY